MRVTALPDKNVVSDLHGLVGSHDLNDENRIPYVLPKRLALPAQDKVQAKRYPITISPYIDKSNQQFNSIIVSVNDDAPESIHQRVISAIAGLPPRKGADGYFFDKKHKKKIESALSDLILGEKLESIP